MTSWGLTGVQDASLTKVDCLVYWWETRGRSIRAVAGRLVLLVYGGLGDVATEELPCTMASDCVHAAIGDVSQSL
jgi:hypothetical protein